jgi:hypothetical protein
LAEGKDLREGRDSKELWKSVEKSARGDVYQRIASGLCSIRCGSNIYQNGSHQAPSAVAENHDREFATLQILLVGQILVGGEQHIKSGILSSSAGRRCSRCPTLVLLLL